MYTFSILFLGSLSTWIISELIKITIRIPRPITEGLMASEGGFSFPSSHASVSMVVGIIVYSIDKKLGTIIIICSILVGVSRVVLGVHYLIDVLAGWIVGIIMGLIFIKLFKNI